MSFILLLICFLASSLGAVAGFGGGVIIKPVLDLLGVLPVATVSFLSGCTVLAMSVSSLLRTRNNGVRLELRTSTPLAIGAVLGGLVGKRLFELVRSGAEDQNALGLAQAVGLTVITCFVFFYICKKDRFPSRHTSGAATALFIGTVLGMISSFFGIGGGTSNIAVLFFFFSMDAKTAAKNSIYIIMFSQLSSILLALAGGTVPPFRWLYLLLMAAGGVGGALVGATVSSRLSSRHIERLLKVLLVGIICINVFNVLKFSVL